MFIPEDRLNKNLNPPRTLTNTQLEYVAGTLGTTSLGEFVHFGAPAMHVIDVFSNTSDIIMTLIYNLRDDVITMSRPVGQHIYSFTPNFNLELDDEASAIFYIEVANYLVWNGVCRLASP